MKLFWGLLLIFLLWITPDLVEAKLCMGPDGSMLKQNFKSCDLSKMNAPFGGKETSCDFKIFGHNQVVSTKKNVFEACYKKSLELVNQRALNNQTYKDRAEDPGLTLIDEYCKTSPEDLKCKKLLSLRDSVIKRKSALPPASQNGCEFYRLDDKGNSMSHIPIYDQEDYGTCYAVVAAQMADVMRAKNGEKLVGHISPLHLALNSSKDEPHKYNWIPDENSELWFEGGDSCEAIQRSQGKMLCDDKFVMELNKKGNVLELLKFEHQMLAINSIRNQCIRITHPTLADILDIIEHDNVKEKLRQELKKKCPPHSRIKMPNIKCEPEDVSDDNLDVKKVRLKNAVIQNNGIPFSISFCADHLNSVKAAECADHAAIVTGRRFNHRTNKCEYLVRNSYGTDHCLTEYAPQFKKSCESDTGSLWVDEDSLANSLIQIEHYK